MSRVPWNFIFLQKIAFDCLLGRTTRSVQTFCENVEEVV